MLQTIEPATRSPHGSVRPAIARPPTSPAVVRANPHLDAEHLADRDLQCRRTVTPHCAERSVRISGAFVSVVVSFRCARNQPARREWYPLVRREVDGKAELPVVLARSHRRYRPAWHEQVIGLDPPGMTVPCDFLRGAHVETRWSRAPERRRCHSSESRRRQSTIVRSGRQRPLASRTCGERPPELQEAGLEPEVPDLIANDEVRAFRKDTC
jgi:hypothetical protein